MPQPQPNPLSPGAPNPASDPPPASAYPSTPPPAVRIHDLPADERPREKMMAHGPSSLTDAELLALFFRTGMQGLSAIDIGRQLLKKYGSLNSISRQKTIDIQKQKGLGPAKALDLAAAFELGKRLARQEASQTRIDNPEAIYNLLAPEMRAEPLEVLKIVLLTTRGTLLAIEEISRGGLTETIAHPREILLPAIRHSAYGFILAHNHPSGDPTPSSSDLAMTRRIRDAALLMQINFFDHVIIGNPTPERPAGYHSFRESGLL